MPGFYDSFVGGQRNALARQAAEAGIAKNALDTQREQQGIDLKQTLAETQWALQAPDPVAAVKSLPHIAAAWQQHGVNIDTLDPAHAKALLQEGQRQAASQLGIGPPEQPTQLQDVPLPGGAIGQRDPRTNALSVAFKPQNEGQTPTAIVGPNRKPLFVSPQDALGKEPFYKPGAGDTFNPTAVENTAQLIASGALPMPTGRVLASSFGQALVSRVKELNPQYQGSTYPTQLAALKDFTSGTSSRTTRSLNVAIAHLGTLGQLATALNNNDTQLLNRAANAWKTATGQSAPTSFNAAKQIVANEIVKAITSTGGALADREEAQREISASNSPEQLLQVMQTYKDLLAGQLGGLQQTYEQGTGRKDFNRFLSKDVISELENSQGQPVTQSQTSSQEYTATDAKGNKVAWRNGQWVSVGQ